MCITNSKDFITAVDESNVIVVKEFSETDTGKEIEKANPKKTQSKRHRMAFEIGRNL